MKTAITIVITAAAAAFSAASASHIASNTPGSTARIMQASGATWSVEGHVLSVTPEGVLVYCEPSGSFGAKKPKDGDVVFVIGVSGYADNDKIKVRGVEAGVYEYSSAGGAAKTVRSFRVK